MKLSAAQILAQIARYLHWIISGTHNRFKYLADKPNGKPQDKNMMLIENTQIINNPNQISKSKLIHSNRSIYLKRLKRGRPKV